jgi:hypothetical protein
MIVQGIKSGFIEAVVLAQFGIQSGNGIEVVALVGLVQAFAEVQVPQRGAHRRLGGKAR